MLLFIYYLLHLKFNITAIGSIRETYNILGWNASITNNYAKFTK